jgi:hypothetical protein
MSALDGGSGSLLELEFRIKAAPGLQTSIDLQYVSLNDGRLILNEVPREGQDPTDGSIAVAPQPATAPTRNGVASVDMSAAQSLSQALLPSTPAMGASPRIDLDRGLDDLRLDALSLTSDRGRQKGKLRPDWRQALLAKPLKPADNPNAKLRIVLQAHPEASVTAAEPR